MSKKNPQNTYCVILYLKIKTGKIKLYYAYRCILSGENYGKKQNSGFHKVRIMFSSDRPGQGFGGECF